MPTDHSHITQDAFDTKLRAILKNYTAEQMLTYPGVYEVLSEVFNNQILDELEAKPRTYYVLLKYPDYMTGGEDQYYSENAVAVSPTDAVTKVSLRAYDDNQIEGEDATCDPLDFAVVTVVTVTDGKLTDVTAEVEE